MILLAKFCKNAANEVLEEGSGLFVSITRYKNVSMYKLGEMRRS